MAENLPLVFYESQYTSVGDGAYEEIPWLELVEILRQPEVVTDKGSAPQMFFGKMLHDADSKGDSGVEVVSCLVIDADQILADKLPTIREKLVSEGVAAILHSTYRFHEYMQHDPPQARIRIILPLKRTVLPEEYTLLWSNMNLTLEGIADVTTRHPSKHYLVPSIPPGKEARDAFLFEVYEGDFLDPDEVMSRFGTKVLAHAEVELYEIGSEPVTGNLIKAFIEAKHKSKDKPTIDAIKRALGRLSYAEEGNRENTLFEIAGLFAKHFPRGNPDDICVALEYSVEFEHKQGGPSIKDFKDKLVRRQRDYLERIATKRVEETKEQAKFARFKATQEPYTEENIKPYLDSIEGLTIEALKKALVLVHRNTYYVFGDGKYHYATQMSVMATIRRYLLYRAEELLDFNYYYPAESEKPPTPKTPDHFVRDHGTVVSTICYTHTGRSWFDANKSTLWISECEDPYRLVAERNPKVELWIQKLCPTQDQVNGLNQWLSQAPNTKRALAALVISGPTGIGKSAFAAGVAQLWDSGFGSMENSMSNFNSEIVRTPLILADESLPKVQGQVPTDKLRSLISSSTHEVNRKQMSIAQLHTFVRVVVAIQNMSKFDFGKGHTKEDNEAIGQRVQFVEGQEGARDYFDYEDFVTNKGIAKHILYLAQQMPKSSERFGLKTNGLDYITAADPYTMNTVDWIVSYLLTHVHKAAEEQQLLKKYPVFVNKGEVYVSAKQIQQEWEKFASTRAKRYIPTIPEVSECVRALSLDKAPHRITMPSGSRESYWRVKQNIFKERAEITLSATREMFDLILKIPHEIKFKTKTFQLLDSHRQLRLEALQKYQELKEGVAA